MSKPTNLGTEFFQITKEKRKGMEKLRWWCITKMASSGVPHNHPIKQKLRDRIATISEILRGQFYSTEQKDYLNKIRQEWIKETRLNKAIDVLNKHTPLPFKQSNKIK
jgi:hypothetical protein